MTGLSGNSRGPRRRPCGGVVSRRGVTRRLAVARWRRRWKGYAFAATNQAIGSGTASTRRSASGAGCGGIRQGSVSSLGAHRLRKSFGRWLWPRWCAAVRRSEVILLGPGGVLAGIMDARPHRRPLRGRPHRHLRLLHPHPRHRRRRPPSSPRSH
jgi:hypothetical protein